MISHAKDKLLRQETQTGITKTPQDFQAQRHQEYLAKQDAGRKQRAAELYKAQTLLGFKPTPVGLLPQTTTERRDQDRRRSKEDIVYEYVADNGTGPKIAVPYPIDLRQFHGKNDRAIDDRVMYNFEKQSANRSEQGNFGELTIEDLVANGLCNDRSPVEKV